MIYIYQALTKNRIHNYPDECALLLLALSVYIVFHSNLYVWTYIKFRKFQIGKILDEDLCFAKPSLTGDSVNSGKATDTKLMSY